MRRLSGAAFFFFVSTLLAAQSYTIVDSVRLPAQSYVGDPVELRYRIRSDESLAAPDELPEPAWGTIETLTVDRQDETYDLRIVVIPFEPGTLTLPRLSLGGAQIDGFSLVVSSVLEENATIEPIFGPQRLPGTRAAVAVLSVAAALSVTLLFYLLGPGRRHLRMIIARYRARLPYRRLHRDLTLLEAQVEQMEAKQFYIELVESIQRYFSSVLRVECRAATTPELVRYLPTLASLCGASPANTVALEPVLRRADDAKFAGAPISPVTQKSDLDLCVALFESLESGRRRMRARRPRREAADDRI